MSQIAEPITELLKQWTEGDRSALDRALPLVYGHLRYLAHQKKRGENYSPTLNTTVLVNELYLELIQTKKWHFENRFKFFSFAAKVMRHILVNHARYRFAEKRGSGFLLENFEEDRHEVDAISLNQEDMLALAQALESLEKMDPRQTQVVELRFFGGLTHEEISEALNLSRSTVRRDLNTANMWLSAHLRGCKPQQGAENDSLST